MLRKECKQAKTKYEHWKLTMCISDVLYNQFMDLSSDVFPTFFSYYWNFDIGIFVLRSSISLEASKKIFGITNKKFK